MMNWYDRIDDMESTPEFFEKQALDQEKPFDSRHNVMKRRERDSSWNRKRCYKKKLVRRFLSMNPSMDFSDSLGISGARAIYSYQYIEDGAYRNPRTMYCLNPYTHIYLSRSGCLRIYQGNISYIQGSFTLTSNDRIHLKLTNKRIRRASLDEERSPQFSYHKKLYSPKIDDLW